MHKMLRAPADFPLRPGAVTAPAKQAAFPSLSDFIYPVLMDTDPAQLIDDEFKNRHKQLYCWRMLKMIAQVDLTTFSKPTPTPSDPSQQRSGFYIFEGNIEEQARIFCKNHMKRKILDHLPAENDEEDDAGAHDMADDDLEEEDHLCDKEMVDEASPSQQPEETNGHVVENESLPQSGTCENGHTTIESAHVQMETAN